MQRRGFRGALLGLSMVPVLSKLPLNTPSTIIRQFRDESAPVGTWLIEQLFDADFAQLLEFTFESHSMDRAAEIEIVRKDGSIQMRHVIGPGGFVLNRYSIADAPIFTHNHPLLLCLPAATRVVVLFKRKGTFHRMEVDGSGAREWNISNEPYMIGASDAV